jgi:type II secretion system (T2SS) protein F
VSPLVLVAGVLAGLGGYTLAAQLIPGGPRLDAALARIHSAGQPPDPSVRALAGRIAAALPWLPVPAADLALLGQDRERWLASKVICGLVGLGAIPALAALAALAQVPVSAAVPVITSLALAAALFFVPDLVTRVNAGQCRADFRHALTSYLDLVALERGAGAGPTDALEGAAQIGGGWVFARIGAALDASRQAGRPPWEGLAALAAQTGIAELSDLADIAEVAGHEGARILQTLAARAESMRAEALAATKAKAGSRSTTMVVPIALLGAGFLLLLIFPIVYRTFG